VAPSFFLVTEGFRRGQTLVPLPAAAFYNFGAGEGPRLNNSWPTVQYSLLCDTSINVPTAVTTVTKVSIIEASIQHYQIVFFYEDDTPLVVSGPVPAHRQLTSLPGPPVKYSAAENTVQHQDDTPSCICDEPRPWGLFLMVVYGITRGVGTLQYIMLFNRGASLAPKFSIVECSGPARVLELALFPTLLWLKKWGLHLSYPDMYTVHCKVQSPGIIPPWADLML
jgi:hypothetical protein